MQLYIHIHYPSYIISLLHEMHKWIGYIKWLDDAEFFRELLKSSKKDFHSMFLQTYGLLYERNSYIFTEMFQELEKYYVAGGVDLNQVLDFFFHRLYSKMFQVLNAQYTFDATYLKCVSEKMEELKPFGDIPKKLKIEVKRSFVATRTFVQSIMSGVEILDKVATITVSNDCSRAIDSYKMLLQRSVQPQSSSFHSSSFDTNVRNGNQRVPLCNEICSGLLTRCLSLHNELGHEWANYVDSLILLSSRLETSFNIESVVDPIDIKISEAIMNFQENGMQVSQKVSFNFLPLLDTFLWFVLILSHHEDHLKSWKIEFFSSLIPLN